MRTLMATIFHEAESSKSKIQPQTEAGAVVKEFRQSLIKKSMARLEGIIKKCPRECTNTKSKSQPNGAKVMAKQKLVEKALSGLDRIASDDLIIKEIIEEEEYRVISRVAQLRTYEEIVVDSSSIQILKLSNEAGIKLNGRDCALLIGGSAVRMMKLLDLQKVNTHIKSNEISNKLI